tara:strand:- start:612 stop:737 length:126 start_codon:yes stop_codon:yes gene_type:complete
LLVVDQVEILLLIVELKVEVVQEVIELLVMDQHLYKETQYF